VLECLGLSLRVAEWETMLMDGRAAGQTSIKALFGASFLHDRQLVYLHGAGNRSPTHFGGGACAPGSRCVSWRTHQLEQGRARARRRLVVRGGDLSCEVETCRVRRRLVRGIPLVGNWSKMLPTGRRLDVLPVSVLIGVLGPPRLVSWP
jgi:hypothetical protein